MRWTTTSYQEQFADKLVTSLSKVLKFSSPLGWTVGDEKQVCGFVQLGPPAPPSPHRSTLPTRLALVAILWPKLDIMHRLFIACKFKFKVVFFYNHSSAVIPERSTIEFQLRKCDRDFRATDFLFASPFWPLHPSDMKDLHFTHERSTVWKR